MRSTRGGGTCLNAPSRQLRHPELDSGFINANKKSIDRFRVKHGMTKTAFTLAEVLITLGIIGVVAAMTMPSLIASHKEKETVVKLKKVYSVLSNAYLLAKEEYDTPDNWGLNAQNSSEGAVNVLNKLKPFMNVSKFCGMEPGCFGNVSYKYLNNTLYGIEDESSSVARAVLADGTMIGVWIINSICEDKYGDDKKLQNVCASVHVDINGAKPPNQFGRDMFIFHISKEGVIPTGTQFVNVPAYTFENSCKMSGNGTSCSAWVILNENMDYLRCNDLSWEGKTKCK